MPGASMPGATTPGRDPHATPDHAPADADPASWPMLVPDEPPAAADLPSPEDDLERALDALELVEPPGDPAPAGPLGAETQARVEPIEPIEPGESGDPATTATTATMATPAPLADDAADDAIDYFSTSARSRRGFSSRLAPIGWVACVLLALLLLAQLGFGGRSVMAGAFPGAQAWLAGRLAAMNLKIAAPRDLASLTIESFELQTSSVPGVLTMSALLRNRADYPVQWPALELSLTDGTGALIVRKVIEPADYLATEDDAAQPDAVGEPIGARAERPLKMAFEARELVPSGFSVHLFYP
ncbi:MAG: DUF3426 domain-containing protein [Burkholderiaceae bacterium]